MKMILVKNKAGFEKIYPYKGYKPIYYPVSYPCLIENILIDGGLGGDYYIQEIVYIPKGVDRSSFIKGVNAERKCLTSP